MERCYITHLRIFVLFVVALSIFTTPKSFGQKIGLLMDSYVIDRWYKDQKHFENRVKELGGSCQIEVAYGDPYEQIKLAKKMITEGVDVLVVVPCDAVRASEIPKMAKESGVPVISYDRLIMSNDLALYVSYNNEKVGELQAEYVVNKHPGGNYLLINGPTSDNNAILFRKGQLKVLQKHIDNGSIKIIGDFVLNEWSEIEALMKVDEFLSGSEIHPDVIVAGNDALASGSIEALKAFKKEGQVYITGQDADLTAIKNIISGLQSMTIYKPIRPLASIAAESAMKLARKEKLQDLKKIKTGAFEVSSILLDPAVVDIDNYRQTVVNDGHVKDSDLK